MQHNHTNHLITEISPYLLQHAHNPVNWYPWGEEAFARAKKENKPIFLSIGYSTCHWCHVMEKEVFEDKEAAAVINKIFISIKVDREERPDIDKLYMAVGQMLTGSGGWPLNIIMTPDKKPFFAATYISKYSQYNRIGIMDLTKKIQKIWQNDKEKITGLTENIAKELNKVSLVRNKTKISGNIFDDAYKQLASEYDAINGGFGTAPKFPQPHVLLFLLKYWKKTGNTDALLMVDKTLKSIRLGGIYDHVGDGFHRYSTDREWIVPHFEKMLYDQAMLVLAYTEAFQATGKEIFKHTAESILTYISRDMTDGNGGFYTAEDADSEGKEGKFYLWTFKELEQVLTGDELIYMRDYYHISGQGNYKNEATGIPEIENILYRTQSHAQSPLPGIDPVKIKEKLYRIRKKRIHPHKDDKILTDWNGLMLATVSIAGRVFNNNTYIELAKKNAVFIMKNLTTDTGLLLHRYRNGKSGIPGFLDDYAFFTWGLIELYQTTLNTRYLQSAINFTNKMIKFFLDEKNGGFYIKADQEEELLTHLIRQKEYTDNAIPAGNSIALLVLTKLARITGNTRYERLAHDLVESTAVTLNTYPQYFGQMLYGLDFLYNRSFEIVIIGNREILNPYLQALYERYIPNLVVVYKNPENNNVDIDTLTSYTQYYHMVDKKPTIYVCSDFKCNFPVHTVEDMMKMLE